jgi:AcrR family transcriptional regulator
VSSSPAAAIGVEAGVVAGSPSIKERLVAAAADVFAEQGYDRARVQDIARRAGLSTGAVYSNFRDKSELLAAAIDLGTADLIASLQSVRAGGASAIELLEVMGRNLGAGTRPTGARDALLLGEAFAAARRDPAAAAGVRAALDAVEADLARLVDRARRDGHVDEEISTPAVVRFGLALVIGYHQIEAAGGPTPDRRGWSALLSRTIRSLRHPSP